MLLLLGGAHVDPNATGPLSQVLRLFDHIWNELEDGDIKTWLAFTAAALFILQLLNIAAKVIINKRKGGSA